MRTWEVKPGTVGTNEKTIVDQDGKNIASIVQANESDIALMAMAPELLSLLRVLARMHDSDKYTETEIEQVLSKADALCPK